MAGSNQQDQPTIHAEAPGGEEWADSDQPPQIALTERVPSDSTPYRGAAPSTPTVVLRSGPPSLAWLIVTSGPWAGRLFRLDPKGTMIGRDDRNEIILDDDAVSSMHAKVRAEGEQDGRPSFVVQDLASTNGTFVNGENIVKVGLNDGDRILIGETNLVFKQV
jgi:pSer/pThr/pTyr-binding forkhead associated (FHA) protein